MSKITPNILNERYGRLVVIEFLGIIKEKAVWRCLCDCGNKHTTTANLLRTGGTKSCGCLKKYGMLLPDSQVVVNDLYRSYKIHAKERNLDFKISVEQFRNLAEKNCYFCGKEPTRTRVSKSGQSFTYNGIDRINNTEGYVIDNCVPCCYNCNQAKSDKELSEFLEWVKRVYEYNFSK